MNPSSSPSTRDVEEAIAGLNADARFARSITERPWLAAQTTDLDEILDDPELVISPSWSPRGFGFPHG
ncbi:MAG TPA: hypothetical protein VKH41_11235 [Myxococcota bacterium]|nr:hypothetical protein [Myxococcota bacterium]